VRRASALAALVLVGGAVLPARSARADVVFTPIARGLEFPTNAAVAPDGRIFVTEKETGRVRIVQDGRLLPRPFATLPVVGDAERGLLGIAIASDFERNPWVYVYLSDASDGRNRVVRLPAHGDVAGPPETIFDGLDSTSGYHNGGDLAFGRDGMLYVVTGEAHEEGLAQDPGSVGGKVLRLTPDGSVPSDNPIAGSPVYALGIRNSFGLCVDPVTGHLWETENGPDRDDEVNLIHPAGNYGWPTQLGPGGAPRFVDPELVFPEVIVPTGCMVSPDGSTLWFGDFGGGLHSVGLTTDGVEGTDRVIASAPAGITDLERASDGTLLVVTSGGLFATDLRLRAGSAPDVSAGAGAATSASDEHAGIGPWVPIAILTLVVATAGAFAWRRRSTRRNV
jgi:glucose/sorbosone dehydrogenase